MTIHIIRFPSVALSLYHVYCVVCKFYGNQFYRHLCNTTIMITIVLIAFSFNHTATDYSYECVCVFIYNKYFMDSVLLPSHKQWHIHLYPRNGIFALFFFQLKLLYVCAIPNHFVVYLRRQTAEWYFLLDACVRWLCARAKLFVICLFFLRHKLHIIFIFYTQKNNFSEFSLILIR